MRFPPKLYSSSAQRNRLPRQRVSQYHSLTGNNWKRKLATKTIGRLTVQPQAKRVMVFMFASRDLMNSTSPGKHMSPVTIVFLNLKSQHNVKIGSNGSTPSKNLSLTLVSKTPTGIDRTYTALTTIQHLVQCGIQNAGNLEHIQNARQTPIVQRATCALNKCRRELLIPNILVLDVLTKPYAKDLQRGKSTKQANMCNTFALRSK